VTGGETAFGVTGPAEGTVSPSATRRIPAVTLQLEPPAASVARAKATEARREAAGPYRKTAPTKESCVSSRRAPVLS
jgi:hypothetical protein